MTSKTGELQQYSEDYSRDQARLEELEKELKVFDEKQVWKLVSCVSCSQRRKKGGWLVFRMAGTRQIGLLLTERPKSWEMVV